MVCPAAIAEIANFHFDVFGEAIFGGVFNWVVYLLSLFLEFLLYFFVECVLLFRVKLRYLRILNMSLKLHRHTFKQIQQLLLSRHQQHILRLNIRMNRITKLMQIMQRNQHLLRNTPHNRDRYPLIIIPLHHLEQIHTHDLQHHHRMLCFFQPHQLEVTHDLQAVA